MRFASIVLLVFFFGYLFPSVTLQQEQTTPTLTPMEVAIQSAYAPVTQNSDWIPYEQDFDGVTMVLVPAGCFIMGNENGTREEKPVHEMCINEQFWIDKYEVTNRQFAQFEGVAADTNYFSGDNRPREQITWFEARNFCEKRGARLPTEAEWEYAARGVDSLTYPWGKDFVASNVVYAGNSGNQTADVGSKPGGKSWVGALDMSGNVSEWMSTIYGVDTNGDYYYSDADDKLYTYPYVAGDGRELDSDSRSYFRVFRGGSWIIIDLAMRSSIRAWVNPDYWYFAIGFRCARSVEVDTSTTVETLPTATETPASQDSLDSALDRARVPVTQNTDWIPYEQDFDGVTMVLVPAGCFMMGSSDEQIDHEVLLGSDRALFTQEQPQTSVCFNEPFWIDKYEVTNRQFAKFEGVALHLSNWTGENRPREQIGWSEARNFCEKRGAHLPTEAEWEYAAHGVDSLNYPWGNDFVADNVVFGGNSGDQTADVGSKPDGESWVGALDMSGNVWEWVNSLHKPYPYKADDGRESHDRYDERVLRGGSWLNNSTSFFRSAFRTTSYPIIRKMNIGFRCARSK